MTDILRVVVDTDETPLSAAIRAAAPDAPLLVLTVDALGDLADELGGHDAAGAFLIEVATEVGRPIGVNADRDDGQSSTAFIAPRSWTVERLKGWVTGRHEAIEATFGPARIAGEGM